MGIYSEECDKILQEKFTNSFRKGYINVKGITMPLKFADMHEDIEHWDISEDDVWICSFPKTGTTWTQEMVWMIVNNLDFEKGQENLGIRSPFFEVSALFDYKDLMKSNKNFQPPSFLVDSLSYIKNQKGPKIIKSHLPWDLLPQEIRTGIKKPKIIYVARNPKDTCVSYYHHCKLMEGYKGDFEEFCKLFLSNKLTYAPYWNHLLKFWQQRNNPNILFLKYEDMKKNLNKIIVEVSKFLDKPLNSDEVKILENHLSFESMKKNPAVNYELVLELNKKHNLIEYEGTFMRSGKVGGYKSLMSPDVIEKFDRWCLSNTQNTGFSFSE